MPLPKDNEIQGVIIKSLKSFPDGRGFFREIFRSSEDIFTEGKFSQCRFSQWSHSKMQKNVVKAWHYHHKQTDWWYIPMGQAQVVLYDNREESQTYKTKLAFNLGEADLYADTYEACVRIPPGVLHSCLVLSDTAHLFYITSEIYDPKDEGRIAWNSDQVPHEWPEDAIVAERDTVDFMPEYERMKSLQS